MKHHLERQIVQVKSKYPLI